MKNTGKYKNIMKRLRRMAAALAGCVLAVCVLAGCGLSGEEGYTREELDNLAKLEIYEADGDALLKTIEDEETLYQYSQIFSMSGEDCAEWESVADDYEPSVDDYESETIGVKEKPEEVQAVQRIVVYKYPVAKLWDKEPKKFLTMTFYDGTDICKIVVADESIKSFSLPEEFLTFYYEMSEEEREFYESLLP